MRILKGRRHRASLEETTTNTILTCIWVQEEWVGTVLGPIKVWHRSIDRVGSQLAQGIKGILTLFVPKVRPSLRGTMSVGNVWVSAPHYLTVLTLSTTLMQGSKDIPEGFGNL